MLFPVISDRHSFFFSRVIELKLYFQLYKKKTNRNAIGYTLQDKRKEISQLGRTYSISGLPLISFCCNCQSNEKTSMNILTDHSKTYLRYLCSIQLKLMGLMHLPFTTHP